MIIKRVLKKKKPRERALNALRFMGDLKNPNKVSSSSSSPISLPPGFRFHPSDHQLCSYYLSHKNNRNPSFSLPPPPPPCPSSVNPILVGVDVIREIDLYNYDPCDLPEFSSYVYGNGGSKKHWYYFTVKGESEGCRRKAKGGFWKCKGRGKDVRGGGGGKEGVVVGRKRSFVFFRCNLTRLSRTNWILVEYSLVDHLVKDPFVLCRVFLKSVGVNKGVENVPSLYAKECIAAKQKICINIPCKQQDAPSTSGIVEVTVLEDTLADKCNNIEKSPLQLTGVSDDAIMAPVVPDNGLHSFLGVPQSGQSVKFSDWYIGDGVISDDAYTLLTMEGDFLELGDLDCPLLGFDSAG